jgi:hypothetical protein
MNLDNRKEGTQTRIMDTQNRQTEGLPELQAISGKENQSN